MNYTRAAESLFISRQALRQALSTLERELGQSLFANDHNHLSLTGYGQYLLYFFQDLVRTFEEREQQAKEFFRRPVELQVVMAASLTPYFLPNADQAFREFEEGHPYLPLRVRMTSDDEALDSMDRGEADLGCVLQMPVPRPGCTATILRVSGVAVSSGPQSPLYGKKEVTLEDLAQVPFIGMGKLEKVAYPFWRDCTARGITLNYRIITNTIDALYQLRNTPASGFGGIRKSGSRVDADEVISKAHLPGYTWEVAALCPKDRPNHAAAQLLAAFLKEKYAQ